MPRPASAVSSPASTAPTPGSHPFRSLIKGLTLLVTLGLAVWGARSLGLEDMVRDTDWFQTHVLGRGHFTALIFVGFAAAYSALGMPRQLMGFLGGVVFGWWWGSVLCTVGCGLGCWLAAGYARLLGREFLCRRFGRRVRAVDAFLRRRPFRTTLAIRLFPLGSNLMTNLAAGVSSIPLLPFILASSLGYYPQNLVFALFGGGLSADSGVRTAVSIGISVALFVAATWLGVVLYRRYRAEQDAEGRGGDLDVALGEYHWPEDNGADGETKRE